MECKFIKQGIRINEDGSIFPCCTFHGQPISFFENFDIDQYFTDIKLDKLNSQLANNIWPKECNYCQNAENHNIRSFRQIGNSTLKDKLYLDVVLGNECNSDCVMCFSGQSSKIASRLRQHPVTFSVTEQDKPWATDVEKTNWVEQYRFWDWLDVNFYRFDSLKFLGGEPFLHKGFCNWLANEQVNNNKKDVELRITTNGSILRDITLLEGWKKLNISVSIDAIGNHYNWIRNGLNWETVENNVFRLATLNNVTMSIDVTIGVYNITNIAKTINWIDQNGFVAGIMPVTLPTLLTLDKTPISILEDTRKEIESLKVQKIQNQLAVASLLKLINSAINSNKCNDRQLKEVIMYFNKHRVGHLDWQTLQVTNG